jgi:hypothetical protein
VFVAGIAVAYSCAMTTPIERDLSAHIASVLAAPRDSGRIELVVRRAAVDQREILEEGILDPHEGLVGDDWIRRTSSFTPDGQLDPNTQLTLMSTRALTAIEPDRDRWPLAGDQIYVDMDMSVSNLPIGTRLRVGTALVEVSPKPHTGCAKFAARFGRDALVWANGPANRELRLRGLNARVIERGIVRPGDTIRKV